VEGEMEDERRGKTGEEGKMEDVRRRGKKK